MSYCTAADIEQDFKKIDFTSSSNVTTAAVTQFITEADGLINSYIGMKYVTPVTADSESLAMLSLFSRTLVSARVRGILENKQQTNVDANQNVKADAFTVKDVMEALKAIRDDKMNLSGATQLLPAGPFYSNNQVNNVTPTMRKDRRQW